MKIKLSKSQWEKIGEDAGWSKKVKESFEDSEIYEIRSLIDDGQRAYRLRKSINACPDFEKSIQREAWKSGYRSAMHKFTVDEALNNFIKNWIRETQPEYPGQGNSKISTAGKLYQEIESQWENGGRLNPLWSVVRNGKKFTLKYDSLPIEDFAYDPNSYEKITGERLYGINLFKAKDKVKEETGKELRIPVIAEMISMAEKAI